MVYLDVSPSAVHILNQDVLWLDCVIKATEVRQREDCPKGYAPSLHYYSLSLYAPRYLYDFVEVKVGAPVPIESSAFRQSFRSALNH